MQQMFHLATECNRLGTSRVFLNEIWVGSACFARVRRDSERTPRWPEARLCSLNGAINARGRFLRHGRISAFSDWATKHRNR